MEKLDVKVFTSKRTNLNKLQAAKQDERSMLDHLDRVYQPQQLGRLRKLREKIAHLESERERSS